ncbi:hypothetical protein [Xanthocytophaga agilis]|uniref:Uncharacterized protein n=1 Tax=Xanthocytophaga agilis TaxID=3048010 RepID=A0AAE3R871_9BACT|nr:hypothetical protein [Xanthocytophaga agilis]MDJ1505025.1 hypothetical protein [Xanthocytophaga agilis]
MQTIVMGTPRKQLKKDLRERVNLLKKSLPSDWRERLVIKYPEYDRLHYATFFNNIYRGYSTDEKITEILEEIVAEYQASLETQPDTPAEKV